MLLGHVNLFSDVPKIKDSYVLPDHTEFFVRESKLTLNALAWCQIWKSSILCQ